MTSSVVPEVTTAAADVETITESDEIDERMARMTSAAVEVLSVIDQRPALQ